MVGASVHAKKLFSACMFEAWYDTSKLSVAKICPAGHVFDMPLIHKPS